MKTKLFIGIILIHFHGLYAINETCIDAANCTASEKTVCKNKVCTCDTLYTFNSETNKCLKYATEYGSICNDVSQCSPFLGDNSKCTNNVCVCEEGYKWYQGKCQQYAGKGENCSSSKICLDHNNPLSLKCSSDICVCSDDYYDRGGDCRRKSHVNGDCAISMDCSSTTSNTYCILGKCAKNSSLGDLVLDDKSLGRRFTTSLINDSKCLNGVQSNLNKSECRECVNTLYFEEEICICSQGFFLSDGICIAELGMKDESAQYQNDSSCPIKPGKLGADGICYCKEYWFQDETNRECKKTTLEYTKNCMDNDWCKAMGPYAFCDSTTEKCECSSLSSLNETTFYCDHIRTNVTDICLSDWECPLYETCKDQKCQCNDGFFKVDNDTEFCLPKIGYSCEVRDCNHIEDAICNSTTEMCDCGNTTYVNDGFKCLPQIRSLNKECEIDEQCQSIPNAACLNGPSNTTECLCNDEYRDVNGLCYLIRSPGSLCSTQTDCTAILGDTFLCRNMLCQCPISKSLNENNVCVINSTGQSRINIWLLGLALSFIVSKIIKIRL